MSATFLGDLVAYDSTPAHQRKRNVLLADGHVALLTEEELQALMKQTP